MAELKLRDGARMGYEDCGSGRPVVFLHGWGMRGNYFRAQVNALSGRFRTIVPDLRGHGASDRLRAGHGFATLVDDIADLLDHLDLSQALLVGWSMGAMLSWSVLGRPAGRRVAGLVTIDMVPRLLNDAAWAFGLRAGTDSSVFAHAVSGMTADWPAFTRVFVPRIFAGDRPQERANLVEAMIRDTETNDAQSMARLWLSMADQDFRDALCDIHVPCLVAYGASSQLYSVDASRWVIEQMPHATGACFHASGHAPHLEEPGRFNEALLTFADGLPAFTPNGSRYRSNP